MRPLRLFLTWLALCIISPWPLCATPTPTFAISSPSAKAGSPETFTISRVSGGSGAYVLFQTYDGTAHAGTDYAATERLVYVKAGVSSVTVSVPTTINPAATSNLTFIGVIASTRTPATGTATIIEPVAPPVQCPDGTTVPAGQTCPAPVAQPTLPELGQSWCPDATHLCHTTVETPIPNGWAEAQIVSGGYARPLGWLYCAGAIVKIEALDANAYLDAATLIDSWGNVYTPPTDGSRLWAVHFVNEGGSQCAATGSTVVFMERDLEGLVQVQ